MEKYKICPICGEKNSPGLLECRICEADLTGVPVSSGENTAAQAEPEYVRICECGFVNPAQARKCRSCGEDISDILPVMRGEEKAAYELCSPDGAYVYGICGSGIVIGREAEMDEYLSGFSFVGRKQAEITVTDDEVRIFNLGKTNPTFVNQIKVPPEGTALKDGDEIGLGGKVIRGERQEKAAYLTFRKTQ